jgi:choline/glycine/proline betaine transport protein
MSRSGNWVWHARDGRALLDFNPAVFVASSVLIGALVLFGLVFREDFGAAADAVQAWIADRTGWFFVLTVNVILGYTVYVALSRYGRIRIGGRDARPQFSRAAWLAMLFSAGMGIGLMFYAVAEPIYHLATPPRGAAAGTPEAYRDAIKVTFMHWGLHAWGIYALTGLGLAYFAFNRGMPLSVRSVFAGLLGHRLHGWWGHVIDIVATVATLFGVATSLGLGAIQVNAGLEYLAGIETSRTAQVTLIAIITLLATISVVLGLDKGIKRLSVFNIVVAVVLLASVFLIGPTLFILKGFVQDTGAYLSDLLELGTWTETYTQSHWQDGWTVFYWGWWIAWSPFVGLFLARISIGRTLREFVGGALLAATLMTFVWLAVFGNSALFIELAGPGGLAAAVEESVDRSLFVFLELLPQATAAPIPDWLPSVLGGLATVAIVTFFVTSSDSGSLVIDIITAGGHPNPPTTQRVYWSIAEGSVAAVLLMGGGLAALQTAAISVGLPFAIVVLAMIVSLHKALRRDTSAARP